MLEELDYRTTIDEIMSDTIYIVNRIAREENIIPSLIYDGVIDWWKIHPKLYGLFYMENITSLKDFFDTYIEKMPYYGRTNFYAAYTCNMSDLIHSYKKLIFELVYVILHYCRLNNSPQNDLYYKTKDYKDFLKNKCDYFWKLKNNALSLQQKKF